MKSKLRKLRLMQFAMIATIPLFGWVTQSLRGSGGRHWTFWHWVMTGLALYAALGGFFLRRKLMHRYEEAIAKDPFNPKALKQWESGHLVGLVSAEAIVIWGASVRIVLGGDLWQASWFWAVGLLLLLAWTPRMPTKPASN
jgi:hypothetical protein